MIKYIGLGHICIIVDSVEQATEFYQRALGAIPIQEFPHFKNIGFAKAAGFLQEPEKVDVSISFLLLPGTKICLELMEYHSPLGNRKVEFFKAYDVSGVRHVCLKVANIDEAFNHLKSISGITMINQSEEYQPFRIDQITPNDFKFFDLDLENSLEEKEKVCQVVGNTRYFYFLDPYGIQWELEQGHDDIGE